MYIFYSYNYCNITRSFMIICVIFHRIRSFMIICVIFQGGWRRDNSSHDPHIYGRLPWQPKGTSLYSLSGGAAYRDTRTPRVNTPCHFVASGALEVHRNSSLRRGVPRLGVFGLLGNAQQPHPVDSAAEEVVDTHVPAIARRTPPRRPARKVSGRRSARRPDPPPPTTRVCCGDMPPVCNPGPRFLSGARCELYSVVGYHCNVTTCIGPNILEFWNERLMQTDLMQPAFKSRLGILIRFCGATSRSQLISMTNFEKL